MSNFILVDLILSKLLCLFLFKIKNLIHDFDIIKNFFWKTTIKLETVITFETSNEVFYTTLHFGSSVIPYFHGCHS